MGKIWKFWFEESILLRNFAPVVSNVSLQDFLLILTTLRPKIPIRYFRLACDQIGKIRKFWSGKCILLRNFAPVVRIVSLQDFLPVLAALRAGDDISIYRKYRYISFDISIYLYLFMSIYSVFYIGVYSNIFFDIYIYQLYQIHIFSFFSWKKWYLIFPFRENK